MRKRSVSIRDFLEDFPSTPDSPAGVDLPVLPHFFHKRSYQLIDDSIWAEDDDPVVVPFSDQHPKRSSPVRRKRDTPLPPNHVIGKSPNVVHYTVK